MIIELLLGGILLSEAIRLYSLLQKRGKKDYFKSRLTGIEQSIWDAEFQRYKVKEIREGIRLDMVALKSKQEIVRSKVQEDLKKTPALTKEQREDLLKRLETLNDKEKESLKVDDERRRFEDEIEKLEVKINKSVYGVGRPKLKEDGTVDEVETSKIPMEVDLCLQAMDEQTRFLNEKIGSLHELKSMVKSYSKREL